MSHSYQSLFCHLVWSTKGRAPYFSRDGKKILHIYLVEKIKKYGVELISIGGVSDHIHILIRMRGVDSTSKFMREIKATSSAFIKKTGGEKCFDFAWQGGYSAFSVSSSFVSRIRKYIANQENHHRIVGFEEELELLSQF